MNVLFIGNSYTHYNSMPFIFQKIATSNTDFQITPTASLPEGIYLLRFENKAGLSVIKKVAKY